MCVGDPYAGTGVCVRVVGGVVRFCFVRVVGGVVLLPRTREMGGVRSTIVLSRFGTRGRFVRTGARRMAFRRLGGSYVAPIFTGSGRLAVGRTSFVRAVRSTAEAFFRNRGIKAPGVQISRMVGKEVPRTIEGPTDRLLSSSGAVCCRHTTFDVSVPAIFRAMVNGGLGLSVMKIETCGRVGLCSGGSPRLFHLTVNFGGRIYYGVYVFASNCGRSLEIASAGRLCHTTLRLFGDFGPTERLRLLCSLKGAAVGRRRFYRVLNGVELCRYLPGCCREGVPGVLLASARVGDMTGTCVGSRGFDDFKRSVGV